MAEIGKSPRSRSTRTATPSAASGRRTSTTRSSVTTRRRPAAITCELAGHEAPLDQPALAKKYKSVDAYMKQFTKGLDAMIKAGYIVPLDRAQLIADQKEKATQVLGQ